MTYTLAKSSPLAHHFSASHARPRLQLTSVSILLFGLLISQNGPLFLVQARKPAAGRPKSSRARLSGDPMACARCLVEILVFSDKIALYFPSEYVSLDVCYALDDVEPCIARLFTDDSPT